MAKNMTPKKVTKKSDSQTSTKKNCVSPDQRMEYIAHAAYFIAQERNFEGGNDLNDWLEAERRIDSSFTVR